MSNPNLRPIYNQLILSFLFNFSQKILLFAIYYIIYDKWLFGQLNFTQVIHRHKMQELGARC